MGQRRREGPLTMSYCLFKPTRKRPTHPSLELAPCPAEPQCLLWATLISLSLAIASPASRARSRRRTAALPLRCRLVDYSPCRLGQRRSGQRRSRRLWAFSSAPGSHRPQALHTPCQDPLARLHERLDLLPSSSLRLGRRLDGALRPVSGSTDRAARAVSRGCERGHQRRDEALERVARARRRRCARPGGGHGGEAEEMTWSGPRCAV